MTRPLSPAFLTTFALALVDNGAAIEAGACTMSAALARRHQVPNGAADEPDVAATPAANPMDGGWSTAFVDHAGYWSHFDHRVGTSIWPLPSTASCTELAAFASRQFVLAADAPEPGDIYLLWSPAKKLFVRAGIVLSRSRRLRCPSGRKRYECLTIDGDTTRHGSLRGPCRAIVQRALSPAFGDRLIRWPLIELISCERPSPAGSPLGRAA